MKYINSVKINIVELSIGYKFSYVSDRVARRLYLIVIIKREDSKQACILEIEREEKIFLL